jgi:PAS domain S-box-containing protein
VLADQALQQTYASIEQWKNNQVPNVPREQVKGADIVFVYSIRKKLLYSFLTRYTQDGSLIVAIAQELEDFYMNVQQFAFDTFLGIQQDELMMANEELKAHQEELQTLNEELKESQEEYEAVNEELIEQIYLRRDIEDALRQSEAKFRLMAENSSDIISTHTPDGKYIYVSPSCTRMLGYTPAELLGQNPYDLIHPDDQPLVRKIHKSLQQGQNNFVAVFRKRTKDNTYKWVEAVCHLIQDTETGQVTELQIATRDIDQRKQAEESLERERVYIKAVLEHIADGIVACDEKGLLSVFNKATRNFHGLPEKHIPADQWAAYYNLYYPDGETLLKQEDIPLFKAYQGRARIECRNAHCS